MSNTIKKLIGVLLGLIVVFGSFLSVFGNPIPKLVINDAPLPTEIPVVEIPVPAPITTPAPKPITNPVVKPTPVPTPTPTPAPVTPTPTGESSYTLAQIKPHDSATTCWSAVNGGVYDLTDWVDSHPGGRMTILMICGKDGSALFNAQHGRSGRVASILSEFKIGILAS